MSGKYRFSQLAALRLKLKLRQLRLYKTHLFSRTRLVRHQPPSPPRISSPIPSLQPPTSCESFTAYRIHKPHEPEREINRPQLDDDAEVDARAMPCSSDPTRTPAIRSYPNHVSSSDSNLPVIAEIDLHVVSDSDSSTLLYLS